MNKITLNEFPTHIAKTNNKIKANKMLKINNQAIYNGFIGRFTRNIVINNLHDYLSIEIGRYVPGLIRKKIELPVNITVDIYTVINHGSISMRSGKLCWKPAKASYEPTWDIDNLATIWIKCINDVLVKEGVLPDDNVSCISGMRYNFIEVQDLKDRKLEITIE